jgi:hypothetical protein
MSNGCWTCRTRRKKCDEAAEPCLTYTFDYIAMAMAHDGIGGFGSERKRKGKVIQSCYQEDP